MTTTTPMDNAFPEPQAICNPITSSDIVANLMPGGEPARKIRAWCADIAALTRSVGKRVPSGNLSCVCAFGSAAWDTLFGNPRPVSLHGLREFGAEGRRAVATPCDILLP
jgi:putative iron-dependent peroxidase